MKDLNVTAKAPKVNKENPPEASVTVPWGETAEETIQLYGSEPVNSNALANAVVGIQSGIRRDLEAGKDQAFIADHFKSWKLGVAIARTVDVTKAIMDQWPTWSEERKSQFLADLKAKGKK